ncbi:hypothetical protein GMORB2_0572 [Geosmithia morbida]|uniref:Transcription factor IIIC 90kDa subunit N-terminal domain-containing protein n=1 Tax=Geosmithia morbida TaxID=1094350 RepID=A0A9P4Z349_9HYPO|nr:uncharacterized protein GMORB2_0572 [Geosmithia morbida]KAF4126835.1 hypothetical protein GMORB2_0572 [Geosmithia morbida]
MHRSQIRPLKTLSLRSRPLTCHSTSWSCDGELAVATDDTIHIFFPEYPRPSPQGDEEARGNANTGPPSQDVVAAKAAAAAAQQQHQFSLSIHVAGIFLPNPSVNARLCASVGVKLPPPSFPGEEGSDAGGTSYTSTMPPPSDARRVTGRASSVSQVIRVEWAPNGLGANLRPILLAMTTNGELLALGAHGDDSSSFQTATRSTGTRLWRILWGLGAGMPIPAEDHDGSYRIMDERVTSFSWARRVAPGMGLLAYATDEGNVVVMGVQYFARAGDAAWQVRELARFDGLGPHRPADSLDPDHFSTASAFSLQWSPWAVSDGSRTASLAYVADNYVGFRRVRIEGEWSQGQDPDINVDASDNTGICLYLSTDAFVQWEDKIWNRDDGSRIARGVIGTPFAIAPFQVDVLGPGQPPIVDHAPSHCSTAYPDSNTATNPIAGVIVHRPPPGTTSPGPVPLYTAVRASATAMDQDWFETNAVPDEGDTSPLAVPSWVGRIRQSVQRTTGRVDALDLVPGADSDSEDTDEEMGEDDGERHGPPVHPHRFRIWGMSASPGGGSTVVLVSKYSTQLPARQAFSKLLFGTASSLAGSAAPPLQDVINDDPSLSTEAKMWEWMYGAGGHVPGATVMSDIAPVLEEQTGSNVLRQIFAPLKATLSCAFCKGQLHNLEGGTEARCSRGHAFATCSSSGLPILAPGVSRVCAVCQRRRLKESELQRLAAEHIGPGVTMPPPTAQLCGGCGAKFL